MTRAFPGRFQGLLPLLGAALLLPGCLQFQKQTILMRVDPDADTLRLRLIEEGWYYLPWTLFGKSEGQDYAAMARDLGAMDHTLCFLTSPLSLDLQNKNPDLADFIAHFRIVDSGHFLNPSGQLSSWQDVQVTGWSEVLDRMNRAISDDILESYPNADDAHEGVEAETIALLREQARAGFAWLRLDSSGLSVHLVAGESQWKRWKAAVAEMLGEEAWRSFLVENSFSWTQNGTVGVFTIPMASEGFLAFQFWNSLDSYKPEFLEFIRSGRLPEGVKLEIDANRSLDSLLKDF